MIHDSTANSTHTYAQYNTFGAKKNYRGVLGEETDIDVGIRNIKSSPVWNDSVLRMILSKGNVISNGWTFAFSKIN